MKTKSIVVYAERSPMNGVSKPGPHQIYRNPWLSIEDRGLDEISSDEVQVKMIYAGICGTDVHLLETSSENGYIRSSAPTVIPLKGRVIGHEGVGKVLSFGSNVSHLKVGSYVTFESIIVCHYCEQCRAGHFNQCCNARLLGLEKDGLFAEVCNVPALLAHDVTHMIRDDRDLRAVACVEPAGVAFVGCSNSRIKTGDVVVVFGAGPIGILAALLSKTAFSALEVHVVEPCSYRREFARKWCDRVYEPEEFLKNPPDAIDVVIEASGHLTNINSIFDRIKQNGRVTLLARSGAPLKLDNLDHMITNRISLSGSRGHLCGAFDRVMSLYKSGKLPLDEIVTKIVRGFDGLYEILNSPEEIVEKNCKVLVQTSNHI